MLNLANESKRLARWQLCLFEANVDIVHRTSAKHRAADALLQVPIYGTDTTLLEEELSVLLTTSGEKMNDLTTTIFTLTAHTSTLTHFFKNTDRTNATPSTLSELITAHFTVECCPNSAKQRSQAKKEFTVYK